MKKSLWLFNIAIRYLLSKKSAFWIILISIFGIMLGVTILILVLSIMNGSQLIYYENSQEILAYHIRIDGNDDYDSLNQFVAQLKQKIPQIAFAHLFFETQGMLVNSRGKQIFILVRGVDSNLLEKDFRLRPYLTISSGEWNLNEKNNIILGSDMRTALSVPVDSELIFYSLAKKAANNFEELKQPLNLKGVYETDWRLGIDSTLAFVPIDSYDLLAAGSKYKIGIKLYHSHLDHKVIERIKAMGLDPDWTISSWRDYNRAFFGALRMEKTVMMLLVFLIFLVFAVNTYNGLNRLIFDKKEELGILRAMGTTPFQVRMIFVFQGLFIAFVGTFLGSLLGLFITQNIQYLYKIFESLKEEIAFYVAPQNYSYYNWNVENFTPPRILFIDLVVINSIALSITFLSALLASHKIGKLKPAEVLRNE